MGLNTTRTAPAVSFHLQPALNECVSYYDSLDIVARALGREDWQQFARAKPPTWSEPLFASPCVEAIKLVFAQDRERAAQRFPSELVIESAEIALGFAVVGRPNMKLPPSRRGMASVEFRRELLGEAYALQRLQDCRMRPDAMRDMRDWIETHAEIPGCWKAHDVQGDLTVEHVMLRAKTAGIIPEMVWVHGIGYDVTHGVEAVATLPELGFRSKVS